MFVIIFLIILFLIPLPIKINIYYENKKLNIFFFKFNITNKVFKLLKKSIKSKLDKKNIKDTIKQKSKLKLNTKKLIKLLKLNTFKPKLKTYINIHYSLDDSSQTAILYGILSQAFAVNNLILSKIFKHYPIKQTINPTFKDNPYLKFSFEGIITTNFAKTIYIIFLIIKSLNKHRSF